MTPHRLSAFPLASSSSSSAMNIDVTDTKVNDVATRVASPSFASSSSTTMKMIMTPPASPSTLERRKQETMCLEPPTLKRKRDAEDDLSLPHPSHVDVRFLDHQSRNKRRTTCSSRDRLLVCRTLQGPLPMLTVTDFTGAPSLPEIDNRGAPVLSLRPRTDSFKEERLSPAENAKNVDTPSQEQDENSPPPSSSKHDQNETLKESIVRAALFVATSTTDVTKEEVSYSMSSPALPSKAIKASLKRTCSTGSVLGANAADAPAADTLSTPLPHSKTTAAVAVPAYNNGSTSNSFMTLSFSKRTLNLSGSSHHNRRGSQGAFFQSPQRSTKTLVQSLEGLCLPSFEDDDILGVNADGTTTAIALQQKRPPSTPQKGNGGCGAATPQRHRTVTSTTFEYLATALRLPDVAFGCGSST